MRKLEITLRIGVVRTPDTERILYAAAAMDRDTPLHKISHNLQDIVLIIAARP
jgi:hypothetical protein